MFDYAANAIRYGNVGRIRCLFREGHEEPEEKLQRHLGVSDPEAYWDEVRDNLDRGEIRMVFVAGQIPSGLRRIVEFLNGQLAPAEVLAVEVTQYEGEGLKTLVPRVVGQTAEAEQKKQAGKTEWDKSTFFKEVASRTSEEIARQMRRVYDLAPESGCEVEWRFGDSFGGVFVNAGGHRLFKFVVSGKVWTNSQYFDFLSRQEWEKLRDWAGTLGLQFPEDPSQHKEPQRSLESAGEGWWEQFESFFEWIREKAEANPA